MLGQNVICFDAAHKIRRSKILRLERLSGGHRRAIVLATSMDPSGLFDISKDELRSFCSASVILSGHVS